VVGEYKIDKNHPMYKAIPIGDRGSILGSWWEVSRKPRTPIHELIKEEMMQSEVISNNII
jgi:hypothetical protein